MGNVYLDDSILTGIANSIRAKTGESGTITPANMASEINDIPSGGTIESLNVVGNGTYTAPSGVDGYSPIVVNVPDGIDWENLSSYSGLNASLTLSSMIPSQITWKNKNTEVPFYCCFPMSTDFKWDTNGQGNTIYGKSPIPFNSFISDRNPFCSAFYDPDTTGTKNVNLLGSIDLSNFGTLFSSTYYSDGTNYFPKMSATNPNVSVWRTGGCIYEGTTVPQKIVDSVRYLFEKTESTKSNMGNMPIGYIGNYFNTIDFWQFQYRNNGYWYPRFFHRNIHFTDVTPLMSVIRIPSGCTVDSFDYNNNFGWYVGFFGDFWFGSEYVQKMNNIQVLTEKNYDSSLFKQRNNGIIYSDIFTWMPNIREFSFELDANNQPIVANWKNQHIYMTAPFAASWSPTFDHTKLFNTLPDTSAYVIAQGATNNITIRSARCINTPTAEEIAVATDKGWTVSLL